MAGTVPLKGQDLLAVQKFRLGLSTEMIRSQVSWSVDDSEYSSFNLTSYEPRILPCRLLIYTLPRSSYTRRENDKSRLHNRRRVQERIH